MQKPVRQLPSDYYGKNPGAGLQSQTNPEDVETPGSIIAAMYECISGPAGTSRDWERLRALSLPESHSIRVGALPDGTMGCKVMMHDDYVSQMNSWLVENGFFEREIHRTEERYGNIAHVFSTYESRRNENDAQPFMRGINSFQLMYDGTRWWIMNVMWQHESPENPIPSRFLSR